MRRSDLQKFISALLEAKAEGKLGQRDLEKFVPILREAPESNRENLARMRTMFLTTFPLMNKEKRTKPRGLARYPLTT